MRSLVHVSVFVSQCYQQFQLSEIAERRFQLFWFLAMPSVITSLEFDVTYLHLTRNATVIRRVDMRIVYPQPYKFFNRKEKVIT